MGERLLLISKFFINESQENSFYLIIRTFTHTKKSIDAE